MPLIDLDAAIAALQSESQSNNPYISGLAMRMADRLRALPTAQPEPAPALGWRAVQQRALKPLADLVEEFTTAVYYLMDNSETSGPVDDPTITVFPPDFDDVSRLLDQIERLPSGSTEELGAGKLLAANILAIPGPTHEPAPALGAEWMRREAEKAILALWQWDDEGWQTHRPNNSEARAAILAIPGPTHAQLLADALALEEVRALVGACRDVIAEREIDGQGDCGCDMCMAVDRMTITIAKLKGDA